MKLMYVFLVLLLTFGCARTISDLDLNVGDGTDNNVTITAEIGAGGSNPYMRYNTTGDKWEYFDGTTLYDFGSGGGGFPTMAKGSIITSNGTSNGEFDACADGERLEWDSAEVAGVKCVPSVVIARARSSAGQPIDFLTYETVIFGTEDEDSESAYDNTTGIFTAPYDGVYTVSCGVAFAGISSNGGTTQALAIYKNGAIVVQDEEEHDVVNTTGPYPVSVTYSLSLVSTDTVTCRAFQGATNPTEALTSTLTQNYISIMGITK
jgi:hypothetical protein